MNRNRPNESSLPKRGRLRRTVGTLVAALLSFLFLQQVASGADMLSRGNEAFRKGEFQEALEHYENEEEEGDRLTRRFNAGVALARDARLDDAIERFEEVSVSARGKIQNAARYNAGHGYFQKAKTAAQAAMQIPEVEKKIPALVEAAQVYRSALSFFQQVKPADDAVRHNIGASKTALRAVVDEIQRLEEEKRRQEEDEALKSPAELLRALQTKESLHRGVARALAQTSGKSVRLGSRRLRKSQTANRELAEKLLYSLEAPPPDDPQTQPPPADPSSTPNDPASDPANDPEKHAEEQRTKAAVASLKTAIEAMKSSEVFYGKLDVTKAVDTHTQAVVALRTARQAFPFDIGQLVDEALEQQRTIHQTAGALSQAARQAQDNAPSTSEPAQDTGGDDSDPTAGGDDSSAAGEGPAADGSGDSASGTSDSEPSTTSGAAPDNGEAAEATAGPLDPTANDPNRGVVVDALKDETLQPIARFLEPKMQDAAAGLADDEDDVVWSTSLIASAEISLPAPGEAPAGPHGQPEQPTMDPEELKKLNETIQTEGNAAKAAAEAAKASFVELELQPAVESCEAVIAALERIRELLPKPPESPEQRLAKLIEKQRAARESVSGLESLEGEARSTARDALEAEQRVDGEEAGAIASELEQRQDEPAKNAAIKVREGEGDVFASAEALRRDLPAESEQAIDRDIAAFEEALRILQGEQGDEEQQPQDGDQDQQQPPNDPNQEDGEQENEEDQSAYALSPDEARREQEKMDEERRKEEAKVFLGGSTVTVEKEW